MNKIITVWGNPNSGKTAFSIKLAKELTRRKKNVILIFANNETPVINTVLPFITTKDQSLGALLSAVQITQESILQKCIPVSSDKYLSIMSYLHGENDRTYAKYNKERIVDFFILLKHLADHIIIDCSSHLYTDIFSRAAIELSNQTIRLISPELKAISYYDSCMPLLGERKYNLSKHIKVLSNVKEEMPKDMVANKFGGVQYELTYSSELERQILEARAFEALMERSSKSYRKSINDIVGHLLEEEEPIKKISLFKRRGDTNDTI